MPLTQEQQLLLHAWADGECSSAEQALATGLLEDPQTSELAREYLRDVRRLRQLVADCGKTRAPAGLQGRVLAAVKAEGRGRVYRPRFGAAFIAAAAAAVLLTAGIALGTGALTPSAAPESPTVATFKPPQTRSGTHDSVRLGPSQADTVLVPAPQPPANPGPEKAQPERSQPRAIVRLDRGSADAPCEVVVDFSRRESVHQAYTDLMMLAALHGRAELVDSRPDPAFPGHDFGAYQHVRVELPERGLPGLLFAVHTMTQQQEYGALWIPDDLRQAANVIAVRSEALGRKGAVSTWMPLDVQQSLAGHPAASAYTGAFGSERNLLIHIKLR